MTTRRIALAFLIVSAAALAGCFDSLVDSPCKAGYQLDDGACVKMAADGEPGPDGSGGDDAPGDDAAPDATVLPDAGPEVDAAPLPDAFTCAEPLVDCDGVCVDLTSDGQNCGWCGHECPSGICVDSACVGGLAGHVIALGHDYRQHNSAMERLLLNSVTLGKHHTLAIGYYRGTSAFAAHVGTTASINAGLTTAGRPHVDSELTTLDAPSISGLDVIVIEAQRFDGDAAEATGTAAAAALDAFLTYGGVVIVLEGADGVSYRLARGAALYDVAGITEVTSQIAMVVDPADAISEVVLSPYLAALSSVVFTGAPSSVVVVDGETLAFHLTH